MLFVVLFMSLSNIINALRNRKVVKEIIDKGIKIPGEIIATPTSYSNDYNNSIFKRATYIRKFPPLGSKKISLYYFAIIKYKYKGIEYKTKTPSLNFYPEYLVNNSVDVFIYNDKVYVDNYKRNDNKINRVYNEHRKIILKIIISFLIMLILSSITFYLHKINIISMNELFISFIILMILTFIIAIMLYLKYISKD